MQSLDNTYSEAELREFHARLARLLGREDLAYVVEPKIDGLAVSLTYEKGRFVRAVTRGNGVEGDDVTANALTIRALPQGAEARGAEPRARPDRDPGRDLHDACGVRAGSTPRARRPARSATPTRATSRRARSSSSTRARSPSAGSSSSSTGSGRASPRGPAATRSPATMPGCARGACPRVEKFWTARGIDEVWAAIGELDRLRQGVRLRDRRRRGEARLARPPAGGREHEQGPALGDGLQVRGRARGDASSCRSRSRWAARASSRPSPSSSPCSSRARRCRGRPCTTATRSRARTSGWATTCSSRRRAR